MPFNGDRGQQGRSRSRRKDQGRTDGFANVESAITLTIPWEIFGTCQPESFNALCNVPSLDISFELRMFTPEKAWSRVEQGITNLIFCPYPNDTR